MTRQLFHGHPVDALKAMSAALGFPPMSPEAEAECRKLCDELVPPTLSPGRHNRGWPTTNRRMK